MSSRRCTICSLNLRNIAAFARCPVCETKTWSDPYVDPTPIDEMSDEQVEAVAEAMLKHSVPLPTKIDVQVAQFAEWLETVSPSDFNDFPSSRA